MLDAAGVTTKVKELHEANNAKKTEVRFMMISRDHRADNLGCHQDPERLESRGGANRGIIEGTHSYSQKKNVELILSDVKGWCRYWKTPKFDLAWCFKSSKGGGQEMERSH
jgi:hypothetical protein